MLKKFKDLSNERYRVIKIGKEALFEFIYESLIDKQEVFYDIKDVTAITSHFNINWETGEFICLIHNDENGGIKLSNKINLNKLMENMPDTTDTLYASNRYLEYSLDELIAIQCSKKGKIK
jgi:hypothetical protein